MLNANVKVGDLVKLDGRGRKAHTPETIVAFGCDPRSTKRTRSYLRGRAHIGGTSRGGGGVVGILDASAAEEAAATDDIGTEGGGLASPVLRRAA